MNFDTVKTSPNRCSRYGYKPQMIVCHTADGTYEGSIEWLCDASVKVSSHYLVAKDGRVAQLVPLTDAAWCNGTSTDSASNVYAGKSTLAKVRQMRVNANYYTVSIEHEGYYKDGHGALTDAQLKATTELIKYIRSEVLRIYGVGIPIDRDHIVGHYQINPVTKPDCPGEAFPWEQLIDGLTSLPALTHVDRPANGATIVGAFDVAGWAISPKDIQRVDVYADGTTGLASIRQLTARPDVAKAYPAYPAGTSGFCLTVPADKLPAGAHTIDVAGIAADGSVCWEHKQITVEALEPVTLIDSPTTGATVSGAFAVKGWAISPKGIQRVDIYADGKTGLASVRQLAPRPDVAKAYPDYSTAAVSGYSAAVAAGTLAPGKHTIDAAGIAADGSVCWAHHSVLVK